MPATFKAPTGPKHDRCIDHVPHAYPKSGKLCIGPTIGRDGMIAFADHLTAVAAEHRAADGARVEAMHLAARPGAVAPRVKSSGRKRRSLLAGAYVAPEHVTGQSFSGPAAIRTTAADAAKLAELVARFRAMRGMPAEAVEPVAVSLARKAAARAPIAETPIELCPATDGDYLVCTRPAGHGGKHDGPAPMLPAQRCTFYHHGGGTSINDVPRCTLLDGHDGAHVWPVSQPASDTYAAAVARVAELTPTCNGCDAIGPVHPVTGYCESCQADAERDTEAAEEVMAAPETHLPAVVEMAERVLSAPSPSQRPTCERCGQSFRKSGSGLAWHLATRLDCARVAVAV